MIELCQRGFLHRCGEYNFPIAAHHQGIRRVRPWQRISATLEGQNFLQMALYRLPVPAGDGIHTAEFSTPVSPLRFSALQLPGASPALAVRSGHISIQRDIMDAISRFICSYLQPVFK